MDNSPAEDMTEVTVAPGRSLSEPVPGAAHTQRVRRGKDIRGNDIYEDTLVDSPLRRILPGQKAFVKTSAVPQLIKMGFILDPATGQQFNLAAGAAMTK